MKAKYYTYKQIMSQASRALAAKLQREHDRKVKEQKKNEKMG